MPTPSRTKMARSLEASRARLKRINAENKAQIQRATDTAVMAGSGFALGYLQNRYGAKTQIMGQPLALIVGIGALGADLLGADIPGLGAVGAGALTTYAAMEGLEMGAEAKAAAES